MKNLIYILTILPLFVFGQPTSQNVVGVYLFIDAGFYYNLELKKDSSFTYNHSFELGGTRSTGKWELHKDTLLLKAYEKPWVIKQVEEIMLDSLGDNSVIKIIYEWPNAIDTLSEDIINTHDVQTKVIAPSKTEIEVIPNFEIWINNQCSAPQITDNSGTIKFTNQRIKTISFEYDDYSIKNPKSNYFILTLSTYPIFVSPPTLIWTKWLLTGDYTSPLECNQQLDYIKLQKQ